MTNEFAIKVLTELRGYGDKFANIGFDRKEALDLAIKALDQQPSEDCISRQAVLRLVEQYPSIIGNRCVGLMADIKHLPPVTPTISEKETVEDCIRREEAIDRMMRKNMPVGEDNKKERFRYLQWLSDLETIKELPSVKPQRKKGRWIEQKDIHKHHYGWFFCSECGAFLISSDGANYCSCCGAEMEVDE